MDMYNFRKFQILSAAEECKDMDIPATSANISEITLLKAGNISRLLTHYFQRGYFRRYLNDIDSRYHGILYKLNDKGDSTHDKLSERFACGMCLNLRKTDMVDWSDVIVLPGLSEFKRKRGLK